MRSNFLKKMLRSSRLFSTKLNQHPVNKIQEGIVKCKLVKKEYITYDTFIADLEME